MRLTAIALGALLGAVGSGTATAGAASASTPTCNPSVVVSECPAPPPGFTAAATAEPSSAKLGSMWGRDEPGRGFGRIRGKEVVSAVVVAPATGTVRASRQGDRKWHKTAEVRDGQFALRVSAGRYLLRGVDGNAHCSTVTVTVKPDRTVHPTITCDGM